MSLFKLVGIENTSETMTFLCKYFIDYQSSLNSNIGYVFINLSHSLDGKPLLGASSDLVSVRRGPGDYLDLVLPPAQLELGQHSPTL